jgi:hypothetical protein
MNDKGKYGEIKGKKREINGNKGKWQRKKLGEKPPLSYPRLPHGLRHSTYYDIKRI